MKSIFFTAIVLLALWGCSNSNSAPNTPQSSSYVLADEPAAPQLDTLTYLQKEKSVFPLEAHKNGDEKQPKIIAPIDLIDEVTMPDAVYSLAELYNDLQKAPELFVFSAQEQKEIICAEGTKIYIPKNAFVNAETGKQINGEVTVQVSEYYDIKDILLTKLSTVTIENLLETGGMVFISATSNGDSCVLGEGKYLALEFNTEDTEKMMQTFTGKTDENENIIWELQNQSSNQPILVKLNDAFQFSDRSNIIVEPETSAEFIGGIPALSNYFTSNLNYPEEAITGKIEGVVYISFIISDTGYVRSVNLEKSLNSLCDEAALAAVAKMPQWKPGTQNGIAIDQKITIPITFSLDDIDFPFGIKAAASAKKVNLSLDNDTWLNGAYYKETPLVLPGLVDERIIKTDSFSSNSNALEISNALIYAQKLGWINCDKILKFEEPSVNYTVKIESELNEEVSLIFDNYNTVLKGNRYLGKIQFNNVPRNENVTLFGIKNIDGYLFYCIKKAVTSDTMEENLEYKPADKEELKLVLNSVFDKKEI